VKVKLEVVKGPERGRVFEINELGITVAGRASDAHFRFSEDDPYVSRRHFVIENSPPNLWFRDLEVINPSRVNDREIGETRLADGDLIEFGFTTIQVSITQDAEEAPVAPSSEPVLSVAVELPPVSEPPKGFEVRCGCGKDLTREANQDGRAEELHGIVQYLCRECLGERYPGLLGDQIGDYLKVKELGEGGMGTVFLAWHRTGRLVAVKVVKIDDPHLAARFTREIRAMRATRHPHVIALIDNGIEPETQSPYLVLEYAPLGGLDTLLENRAGPLPPLEAAAHVLQALRGLCFVHQQGILHRDIKPENILLSRDGNGHTQAKLADFGLAREFTKVGGSILTKIGTPMGTMLYMPPEQIMNAHGVGEPADIYSMGVTLYVLLTGQYPYDFPSQRDVLGFLAKNRHRVNSPQAALRLLMEAARTRHPFNIILEDEPIPLRKRQRSVPAKLAKVVDTAIRKKTSQRYPDADAFRIDLERAVQGLK